MFSRFTVRFLPPEKQLKELLPIKDCIEGRCRSRLTPTVKARKTTTTTTTILSSYDFVIRRRIWQSNPLFASTSTFSFSHFPFLHFPQLSSLLSSSSTFSLTVVSTFSTDATFNKNHQGRGQRHHHQRKTPKKTSSSSPSSLAKSVPYDADEDYIDDDDDDDDPLAGDSSIDEELGDERPFHQLKAEFQTLAENEGHAMFVVQPDYQLNEKETDLLGIGTRVDDGSPKHA